MQRYILSSIYVSFKQRK